MEWICKECKKRLKNQNPTPKNTLSFDMYYFCSDKCKSKYEESFYEKGLD